MPINKTTYEVEKWAGLDKFTPTAQDTGFAEHGANHWERYISIVVPDIYRIILCLQRYHHNFLIYTQCMIESFFFIIIMQRLLISVEKLGFSVIFALVDWHDLFEHFIRILSVVKI